MPICQVEWRLRLLIAANRSTAFPLFPVQPSPHSWRLVIQASTEGNHDSGPVPRLPRGVPASLGQRLAPFLTGGFFRPLSRPTAAVYVDCAERLMEAADDGGQIPHDEARVLIGDVLLRHPDIQLDEDEGGHFRDLGQRAGQFFNRLLEARWIEPRRVNLDEQYVLIAPPLRRLVRLLRELAEDRPAELKDFAATLRSLCQELLVEGALDASQLKPEQMRQKVKDLLDRAGRAEDQMHAVESLILQHEAAQRVSDSPQATLQRFLVEFHAGEHMVCYAALQEAGLLNQLARAQEVAHEARHDALAKNRLAEGLARHRQLEPSDPAAYAEAERWLGKLERILAAIPIKQRLIDGRMADFSRLSAARYRYQTEMRGRRPEQVKAYLDAAAALHAGQSFGELVQEPGMPLLSPIIEVYFGRDSLARPRTQRAAVDLSLAAPNTKADPDAATDEIRRRNLNVLTPQRAAKFIDRHLPKKGDRVCTADLQLVREDDLLDLLAVLAFDRGNSVTGSGKQLRWRVHTVRADFGTDPGQIPRDLEAGRYVERCTLERLA